MVGTARPTLGGGNACPPPPVQHSSMLRRRAAAGGGQVLRLAWVLQMDKLNPLGGAIALGHPVRDPTAWTVPQ